MSTSELKKSSRCVDKLIRSHEMHTGKKATKDDILGVFDSTHSLLWSIIRAHRKELSELREQLKTKDDMIEKLKCCGSCWRSIDTPDGMMCAITNGWIDNHLKDRCDKWEMIKQ